jgi:hypothetical protein
VTGANKLIMRRLVDEVLNGGHNSPTKGKHRLR